LAGCAVVEYVGEVVAQCWMACGLGDRGRPP
jgi:hypothetical protein